MSSNVLDALMNILKDKRAYLGKVKNHVNLNRVNGVGDLLEYYVKDAFCGDAFYLESTHEKLVKYREVFSYLGNSNNPPDFIIRKGPAVEVKKKENLTQGDIALNSSQPKDYLYQNDSRINRACASCEDDLGGWTKKDMIYSVGNVRGKKILSLWFVYGDCYAADKSVYDNVFNNLKSGIQSIPNVQFSQSRELGRINNIDPLGITYLRLRGMWGISHPSAIYSNLIDIDVMKTNIFVLMKKDTYFNMDNKDCLIQFIEDDILKIEYVQIPDPNNPIKLIDAVLLTAKF